jgi:hypothetical protein
MVSDNAPKMGSTKGKWALPRGTTLVELTVATALMATVFAAIMPLFAGVRNSAEARWASLEMVQNARVLNEQLGRYLAQARRIAAVSGAVVENGYLEFAVEGGAVYRCAVDARGYVQFGPVGKLHELAGPVDYLRFACYSDSDFDRPVQEPGHVRLVTWEAGFRSTGHLTQGKVVTGACCLRTDPMIDCGASVGERQ